MSASSSGSLPVVVTTRLISGELGSVQRPAGRRQAAGLGDLSGGVVLLVDQPVVHRVVVKAAQRRD
jgi:hypothetical protein